MRPALLLAALASVLICSAQSSARSAPPATSPSVPPAPPAVTQEAPATTTSPSPTAALTKEDVDAWLDGFLPYALHQGDIAGAVVVVVKDGQILTQRGFGYSDIEARKPVDPAHTLFRPGSVSKLFTWTAVMQQVEQGKLDLDTDVNTYLDFKIPARDGKPITLRNIMTHTPGFEEQIWGLMGEKSEDLLPLDQHLKRWTPTRIFAAGETPAYSNYATALAGYIVSRVSGMPFEDYLDKNLFEPLDMQYSTFRQPLPERLQQYMSKGYVAASLKEKPFEFISAWPAGSLSSPGADMAHFMIAHLQKGKFGDKQILKPETAEMMHGTPLTILPRLNRMLLGFYESNYNGRRVIGHGGDTIVFHSDLMLFIDDGVGLYISLNSAGKEGATGPIRSMLVHEFADRYLPGPGPEGQVDAQTAAEHARMIVGRYTNSRRPETSFFSLLNLASEAKVMDNGDGTIGFSMAVSPSGVPLKWREIEPFVWKQEGSKELLSAKVDNGKVVRFSFSEVSPFMMFDRTAGAKSGGWLLPAVVVGFVALLLTGLAWPISALMRRHYRVAYALAGQDARAHRLVRVASVATAAMLTAWVVTIMVLFSNFNLLGKSDAVIYLLQILSPIAFIGGAGLGVWNASVVLRSQRSVWAKVWAVVLALSFLIVLWVALAFHLISFGTKF